ncbi:MAG: DUF4397 domain-containing protein [Peptostreptococcaceae bacterium]
MRNFNENYSLIRVLHAIPRGKPFDIYLNGALFFNRVLFTQFTPYIYVPQGIYNVEVFESMTLTNPILKQSINVSGSQLATLAITGYYDDLKLLLIPEDKSNSNKDTSKLRIVHLSPNLPELNILLNGKVAFSEIDFRDVTPYLNILNYEIYTIDIELHENNRLLRSNQIAINKDRVYSLYLLGNFANFQVFQSRDGSAFLTTVVRN